MSHDKPQFVISAAASLAGMHPQTLRQYDRLGLVSPSRAAGRGRRYSMRDIERLREVQRLSQDEGINLAGIKRIMRLQSEVDRLTEELERARNQAGADHRVFSASTAGEVVALRRGERPRRPGTVTTMSTRGAVVLWRPR